MYFENLANFIKKLYAPKEIISLHEPLFFGNEKKYLENCIDSGYVSSVGSYVNEFEKSISDYTKCKNAILCLNGTNSIHICLQLAGVKKGDEVITQALSFVATANAALNLGAKIDFVDIDINTYNIWIFRIGCCKATFTSTYLSLHTRLYNAATKPISTPSSTWSFH